VSYNLNLDSHIIFTKPRYPNTGPDGLVAWHPFCEIPHHSLQSFIVEGNVIRIHPENLRQPAPLAFSRATWTLAKA
jgi:hypothetical protein